MKMDMESPFYMDTIAGPPGRKVGLTDYDSLRQTILSTCGSRIGRANIASMTCPTPYSEI
jgi:hypothetical protein